MVRFLSIIFEHILDFADNTAIHGPRYISDKNRTVFERLVHILVGVGRVNFLPLSRVLGFLIFSRVNKGQVEILCSKHIIYGNSLIVSFLARNAVLVDNF